MTLDLPSPIAGYFAASPGDGDAASRCFAEQAVVKDEGKLHRGRAAIRQWRIETAQAYDYTSTPVAVASEGGKIIVTAHVSGSFPGSPVDLRYVFTLAGDEIAALEIRS